MPTRFQGGEWDINLLYIVIKIIAGVQSPQRRRRRYEMHFNTN